MRALSANTYVTVFLIIGVILSAIVGTNMLYRMEQVTDVVREEHRLAAEIETQRAIDVVLDEIQRVAQELAQWDEVHQQLANPTYYGYWKAQRLPRTTRIPGYVYAIELYGPDGRALIYSKSPDVPQRVPDTTRYLQAGERGVFLYVFAPIESRDRRGEVAGYVGVKSEFLPTLRRLNRFVYTEAEGFSLAALGTERLAAEAISSVLSFDAAGSPESSRLRAVMTDTLRYFAVIVAGLIIIFYWVVTALFTRPLRRLERHIGTLRRGNHRAASKTHRALTPVAEMETLRRSLDDYQQELDQVHSQLDQQNVELWTLAHMDPLTGVHNRRAFDDDWRSFLELVRDQRLSISYMLFDCDFFKAINDTYGHETGDKVIQVIADSLQQALRKGDKLYRLGGDEFAAILLNVTKEGAENVARRCIDTLRSQHVEKIGIQEPVKLSVGIAHASGEDMANLTELPKQADMAMYYAKRATRKKVVHYSSKMNDDTAAFISNYLINTVLYAVETGDKVQMHYQPVWRISGNEIDFFEALVRIRDQDDLIGPGDIFPIVNRQSLEAELDLTVIRSIHRDLSQGHLPKGSGVSINVSAPALGLPEFYEACASLTTFLDTHKIVIEITETTLITHLQNASENLDKLRSLGFVVALDDFGSGYSSIRYLANMPVDIVKFDITMIQDLDKDARTRSIIVHTAKLIMDAGYELVAEGIETEETRELVIAMGATHLQGYLLGRPERLPAPAPGAEADDATSSRRGS